MTIKLSPKFKKEVAGVLREYGYSSEKDFIEDALLHRMLELRKSEFLSGTRAIKERMKRRKIREEDILKDFDKFYHRK